MLHRGYNSGVHLAPRHRDYEGDGQERMAGVANERSAGQRDHGHDLSDQDTPHRGQLPSLQPLFLSVVDLSTTHWDV